AEPAVAHHRTDFVGFGRTMIADPELPDKLAAGRPEDVIHCIHCNRCLGERKTWDIVTSLGGVRCSVNATTGRERESAITPAKKAKKVLVIGGGPAGMEAARVAALRGHRVTLFEERRELGGTLPVAAVPPFKEPINGLTEYLARQLKKQGVDIKLGVEASLKIVEDARPDVVIIATGAAPFTPDIPGIDRAKVVEAESVLAGKADVGNKVVVIGAESVGCETAEFLADKGKKVTVTRRGSEIATNTNWTLRRALLIRLEQKGVVALTGVNYQKLTDRGLVLTTKEGKTQLIEADTVVIAAGARPRSGLYDALKDKVAEVYRIGDCVKPRDIMEAISEAYDVARSI
ncbi:MAG: FAD-dependent oxidoreductase, partial [Dehalococcoidia bacterium]|nr:FAD-dependent oxidoreductase [Dehalococcoidia bacterium]